MRPAKITIPAGTEITRIKEHETEEFVSQKDFIVRVKQIKMGQAYYFLKGSCYRVPVCEVVPHV